MNQFLFPEIRFIVSGQKPEYNGEFNFINWVKISIKCFSENDLAHNIQFLISEQKGIVLSVSAV